ncbi:MAG: hypothetical protein EPO35_03505 [Acidobacteria bacterium]|nr:MAG: hypothetical protein EPO35_03505 [Acidobacteriota bacterium]
MIWSTAALTLACLGMAVTETSQWGHYLIDKGEAISLFGLAFILAGGFVLYRQGRLRVSLPFALPWLLYPVITQGDQIIDNLSITSMQVICQVLLTLIFWVPIAVLVLAAKFGLQPKAGQPARTRAWTALVPGLRWIEQGRVREGSAVMTLALLTLEIWVAYRLLGAYMVATLIALILLVLWRLVHGRDSAAPSAFVRSEASALVMLLVGIAVSFGLYIGYKNRPGAYQGSPSYLFDPSQPDAGYKLDAIKIPTAPDAAPAGAAADDASQLLGGYADALQELANGYYILDRNYTHHFHNVLFARSWPILPNFRAVALSRIADARRHATAVGASSERVHAELAQSPGLVALIDEMEAFLKFNFERAALLETLSAKFIETNDGLQHAAHIYEGEGKLVGMQLGDILKKHAAVLDAPNQSAVVARFKSVTAAIYDAYKDRVVGF